MAIGWWSAMLMLLVASHLAQIRFKSQIFGMSVRGARERSSNKHYVSNVDDYLTRYRKVFFPVLFEYTIAFSRFTPHSLNGVLCLQQQYFKYDQ